jgi:phage baseplate assembly protein gpV
LARASSAAIEATGGITIRGDVAIEGKLTASDDVIADGKSLKNHTHGGVQAGAAHTQRPD